MTDRIPPIARVLLVEDEVAAARLLARMLREDGFVVEVAFDGAEAIGRLTRDPLPDAVVTDLRLPLVDGLAVARYARARSERIAVVFVTGYPETASAARLDPEPRVHVKPCDYADLSRSLREAVGAGR